MNGLDRDHGDLTGGTRTRARAWTPEALLIEFAERGIVYCHWKSNSHLDAALAGLTDLDLLFDRRQIEDIHAVLADGGFKRFVTDPSRAYAGTEDFLGVHPESGNLVHLHVHYELQTGPRHLKNYRLPWTAPVLATRVVDPETGVFIADPTHELFLLVVRAAMKIRGRDRLKPLWGATPVADDLTSERRWLAARTEPDLVCAVAKGLLDERSSELVAACLDSDFAFRDLLAFRRHLREVLAPNRTYGGLGAILVRARRELKWALGSINRKWLRRGVRYARTPAGGGLVVALVGSDGSGKSTVGNSLYRWLAGKVDVVPIYFGSGKGASSVLRWPLQQARKVVKRRGQRPAANSSGPNPGDPGLDRVVWALVLAREKRIKLRRAARARGKGLIVVCDRYPQTQTPGMIDGPLLSAWLTSDDAGRRRLARWETASYALAGEVGPDLMLRLEVSKETARSRRSDVDPNTLDMRQEVVAGLEYPEARFGLQSIDGERDLDSVLLDVKESIWNVL